MKDIGQLTQEDLDRLPRHVRRRMRAKLLNLLVGLGIQPMVDKKTGQLVVDFKSMRDALGLSEAEAMAAIRRGDLLRTKRSDLDPMN